MADIFILGLGGFLGAILRYWLSGLGQNLANTLNFPFGTLLVNLLGCLFIGLFSGLAEMRGLLDPQQRLFLLTGLLGALTTFSTFGLETLSLFEYGQSVAAILNILANVVLGLAFVLLGKLSATWFWRF